MISNQYLLGLKISNVDVISLHDYIDHCIAVNKKTRIGNLNINAANIGYENKWYKNYVNSCDVVFCDGKGIQLGLLISKKIVPPQITYHTWMWDLVAHCEKKGYRLYLLGSKEGVANEVEKKFINKFPSLLVRSDHGYFNKDNEENISVINNINDFGAQILVVGFGMPLQEKWILDNIDKINANIFLNGGAFLDWISGVQKQAPSWMTKCGLEWLYRFIKEPRRLFKRYIIGNPLFMYRIIKQKIKGF